MTEKALRKLPRSNLNAWKMRQAKEQGGVCPLSLTAFDPRNTKDMVIDHNHLTGEIRGVLSRSGNAVEGKVKNAVARWGGCGEDYDKIIAYLERLIEYLKQPGTGLMYHTHLTPDEKRLQRNAKARKARAAKTATAIVRERQKARSVE